MRKKNKLSLALFNSKLRKGVLMVRKKQIRMMSYFIVLTLLVLALLLTGCAGEKTEKPIVFGYADWDTVQIMSRIAGFIVEHGYGYPVGYAPAANVATIAAIQRGDIDIHMECAERSLEEQLRKLYESGQGEKVGISYPGT